MKLLILLAIVLSVDGRASHTNDDLSDAVMKMTGALQRFGRDAPSGSSDNGFDPSVLNDNGLDPSVLNDNGFDPSDFNDSGDDIQNNIAKNFKCSQSQLQEIAQKIPINCATRFLKFSQATQDAQTPEETLAAINWNEFCSSEFQSCVDTAIDDLQGSCFNELQIQVITNGACAMKGGMCARNSDQEYCGVALFKDQTPIQDDLTEANCETFKGAGCCAGQLEYVMKNTIATQPGVEFVGLKDQCEALDVEVDVTPCSAAAFSDCNLKSLANEVIALGNGETELPSGDTSKQNGGSDSGGIPTWAIACIAVGSVLIIGGIAVAMFMVIYRRQQPVRYHIQADAFDDDGDF